MTELNTQMSGESLDIAEQRKQELKQLFPGVFTEVKNDKGEIVEAIDFERLKAELGNFSDLYEGRRERYGMEWPGKRDCLRLIQEPSRATLKPCREESVDFDNTENLFIEGDNLEVLKLLQKAYYGKIKMIYIDPPYNTGKDFIYSDSFSDPLDSYLAYAGLSDDEGRKFSTNSANEGRFHTRWLNMLYPRLYLARNLLREDGVIFISIDDNELENLRKICGDIFGESNFVAQMIWNSEGNTDNQAKIKVNHEYVLVFAKDKSNLDRAIGYVIDVNTREDSNLHKGFADNNITKNNKANPPQAIELPPGFKCAVDTLYLEKENVDDEFFQVTKREKIISDALKTRYGITNLPVRLDSLDVKNGVTTKPCKMYSGYANADKLKQYIENDLQPIEEEDGSIDFYLNSSGCIRYRKQRSKARNILSVIRGVGTTEKNRSDLRRSGIYFDYPKPVGLLSYLIKIGADEDGAIILDFFSGSGTLGHAVLEEMVAGKRKNFILVQLPEPCSEDSLEFKSGFMNVADICKARMKLVSQSFEEKYKNQIDMYSSHSVDFGFKVFKLNRSNFKAWSVSPNASTIDDLKKQLELHIDPIDPNATQEDILYELLIKAGVMPTKKIELIELAGHAVFSVDEGGWLICLQDKVEQSLIDAVLEKEPVQFICLDRAFHGNDQLKANAVSTFANFNEGKDKADQIEFRTV